MKRPSVVLGFSGGMDSATAVGRLRDAGYDIVAVTELRKKITPNGTINERNKVFVYQEDLDKFTEGLAEVVEYMRSVAPEAKSQE